MKKKGHTFNPVITRIKLEKEQVVLSCCVAGSKYKNAYERAGHNWCGSANNMWGPDGTTECECGLGGVGDWVAAS